jgi:hypothetical protein
MVAITIRRWTCAHRHLMIIDMTQPAAVMLTSRRWLDFGRSSAALCR